MDPIQFVNQIWNLDQLDSLQLDELLKKAQKEVADCDLNEEQRQEARIICESKLQNINQLENEVLNLKTINSCSELQEMYEECIKLHNINEYSNLFQISMELSQKPITFEVWKQMKKCLEHCKLIPNLHLTEMITEYLEKNEHQLAVKYEKELEDAILETGWPGKIKNPIPVRELINNLSELSEQRATNVVVSFLKKRFEYHFRGKKQTNDPEHPEWYVSYLRDAIITNQDFLFFVLKTSLLPDVVTRILELAHEKLYADLLVLEKDGAMLLKTIVQISFFMEEASLIYGTSNLKLNEKQQDQIINSVSEYLDSRIPYLCSEESFENWCPDSSLSKQSIFESRLKKFVELFLRICFSDLFSSKFLKMVSLMFLKLAALIKRKAQRSNLEKKCRMLNGIHKICQYTREFHIRVDLEFALKKLELHVREMIEMISDAVFEEIKSKVCFVEAMSLGTAQSYLDEKLYKRVFSRVVVKCDLILELMLSQKQSADYLINSYQSLCNLLGQFDPGTQFFLSNSSQIVAYCKMSSSKRQRLKNSNLLFFNIN